MTFGVSCLLSWLRKTQHADYKQLCSLERCRNRGLLNDLRMPETYQRVRGSMSFTCQSVSEYIVGFDFERSILSSTLACRHILLAAPLLLVKVSAAVGAVLGLADVAMHSCICSVTGVCTLADKAIHSYICSVTSVCIYSVYKHVAPTFSDRYQSINY
jgi:hypothetical protein